jgi:UDP-glucose 4-epimerase
MRVVIAGGSGFLSRHLTARLAISHEVTVISRKPAPAESGNVSYRQLDFMSPWDTRVLPPQADAVFHLAASYGAFPAQARELFQVNTASVQQLLDYALIAGAKQFVLASSGGIYGPHDEPCRETDTPRPEGFYAAGKYAAELIAREYAGRLKVSILRFYFPYGPGQTERLIPSLAATMRRGDPVKVNVGGKPRLTPIYIDDAVEALCRALESDATGSVNVAGGEAVSIRELAEIVGRLCGVTPKFQDTGQKSGDWMGDTTRMKELLGSWPMISLEAGLARTFATTNV